MDGRAALVAAPIAAPGDDLVSRRWAAFCAATVDLLCWRDNIPIPGWTEQPLYRLPEPWFVYEDAPSLRPWMLATTPTPFRMRKIFTGSEVLSRV